MPPIVPGFKPAPAVERCDEAAPTRQERIDYLTALCGNPNLRVIELEDLEEREREGWRRTDWYVGEGLVIVCQD
jgi:hypothetical protein